MARALLLWAFLARAAAVADEVKSLPGVATLKNKHYAGYAVVNETTDRQLFYWFVEAESGNQPGVTPNIIWMNGGPGASSIMGLMVENIGPLTLQQSGELAENPHAWSGKNNVMIIDNPVGSGFSFTGKESYVKSEKEMREDFYTALKFIFTQHPEYARNPLWVTGESYGGKYVPNVAYEIHIRGEFPLKGIIIGNGVYSGLIQNPTVPEFAYNQGLIDEHQLLVARDRALKCVQLIEAQQLQEAEKFCEDSVRNLYASNTTAGGVFYYDVGLKDASFLDKLTDLLGRYLNSPETRSALHVGNRTWRQADEVGPVAEGLILDFETPQGMRVIESLLDAGKGYRVVTYNGVRDGSVCNHLGNLLSMKALKWYGSGPFNAAATTPWRPLGPLAGYQRSYGPLSYYTMLYTGHLVPMIVPDTARALIEDIVSGAQGALVV